MGLTSAQLAYLRSADQRFRARIGVFPSYNPTITFTSPGVSGTALAPLPMPMVTPRLSIVANGGAITLYATDSYNRGGAYVGNGNIAWANTGGAGSLVNNGDGTATYTAPGGSGTNAITMTATNANGTRDAVCYVQYPDTTNDAIVADIASISGGVEQHGWNLLLRVAGDASSFTIGSRLLIHVEDTWAGTTSTFGGYRYSEGVFSGYIKEIEYFEDAFGQSYVGIECASLWWLLERLKMGETWWGHTAAAGRFYLSSFAPVDAVWHFVNTITDVSKYHNCTLFYDTNIVDDFIVEESNLSIIIEDCMARGLTRSFTDRYGSLMCIPDPDVRAGEWWGTPAPVFDSGGDGPLTEQYCSDYTLTYNPYQVRKLATQALDHSLLGLWAISQNTASSLGEIVSWPGKLLCDTPTALAQWTVQLRAKMNRKWQMQVTRYLDHTIDLMNFVDVNFTSPGQTNGLTASGRTWVNSVMYRPNIFDGGWLGNWELYKQTSGDTEGSSAWGGTGQYWGGVPEWPPAGPGSGSWGNPTGGETGFCHIFDFINSGGGGWEPISGFSNPPNAYVGPLALTPSWTTTITSFTASFTGSQARMDLIRRFPSRVITGYQIWTSASDVYATWNDFAQLSNSSVTVGGNGVYTGATSLSMSPDSATEALYITVSRVTAGVGDPPILRVHSARVCGLGADPFNS